MRFSTKGQWKKVTAPIPTDIRTDIVSPAKSNVESVVPPSSVGSITVDYLQKKTKKNEGEVPQYYVEGNHEAIIEPSVYDLVQVELAKRSKKSEARYSGVSIFSNKIKCAECGSWYGSKVWHSNDKYRRVIYRCNHKFDGNRKCETPHVTEEEIIAAFIKAMNTLITERDAR